LQFWNLWSARTRRTSLFEHGLCSNPFLVFALGFALVLVLSYVYLPGLNTFLGGAPIPWQCWAIVSAVSLSLCVYNEFRKLLIRHFTKRSKIIRYLKW